MTVVKDLKQLYEIDDQQWLSETINLLKQKKFNELDLENLIEELDYLGKSNKNAVESLLEQIMRHLIEELDYLGKSNKNAVESLLEQIMRHLLLLQYWEVEYDRNVNHWEAEVIGFRNQLKKYLTTNLRQHLVKELTSIYQDALKYVKKKTNFKVDFPPQCPYTLEQLLDENYL
jgi:hypothetical protein